MKKQVLKLLQMSAERYENMIIDHYLVWCDLNSCDDEDCQVLLANRILFNWWYKQYSHLEANFLADAALYNGKADAITMRDFYTEIVVAIKNYYPLPLLKQARKQKTITAQLN